MQAFSKVIMAYTAARRKSHEDDPSRIFERGSRRHPSEKRKEEDEEKAGGGRGSGGVRAPLPPLSQRDTGRCCAPATQGGPRKGGTLTMDKKLRF